MKDTSYPVHYVVSVEDETFLTPDLLKLRIST